MPLGRPLRSGGGRAGRAWIAAAILLTLLVATLGLAAFLGYFGGPVFTEIPATGHPRPGRHRLAAVIMSGDMGFNMGMAPRIAARLAADGIPVIGVNSLTYFRHERTPAEVQALIARAARLALAFGHADRVVMIGQSFGGDMLHVGLTGMAPALRAKLLAVALVVPTDSVIFRASPSELLDWATPEAKGATTARLLTWLPVLCIYGIEERRSLCPLLSQPNVRRVALPGGHPLHGDVDTVYRLLAAMIQTSGEARR